MSSAGTGTSVSAGGTLNRALVYDWECRHVHQRTDEDVAFWLDLVTEITGPCLELACGTGRVTWPLARAGVDIIGLDHDPEMLAAAAHVAPGTPAGPTTLAAPGTPAGPTTLAGYPHFVAADMRRFAFPRRFATIIIPYNSLQLLTTDLDMVDCLTTAAAHLDTHGRLGLEVTDFQLGATIADVPDQTIHADDTLTLSGSLHHDFVHRTSRYHRRFDGHAAIAEDDVTLRSLNRSELTPLLTMAGLTAMGWWETGPRTRVVASRIAS